MHLTKEKIIAVLIKWNEAYARYDLNAVIDLFHDDVLFDNWTGGQVRGKEALRQAWGPWFENHGGFRFSEEDTFVDEAEQKVLFRWRLEWPSMAKGYESKPEVRRGVDVIHFKDGKIIKKLTYSKTSVEIDGERVNLTR